MSVLSNELFYDVHRGINTKSGARTVDKTNLGMHWSTSQDVAQHFANSSSKYPSWASNHARVIHAQVPISSVETDDKTLQQRGFAGFKGKDPLGEKEVPVREGAPVRVTGITKLRESKDKNELKSRTRRYNPSREMKA